MAEGVDNVLVKMVVKKRIIMMVILMIMKRKRMMRWGRITSTTSTPMLKNDFIYDNEDHNDHDY